MARISHPKPRPPERRMGVVIDLDLAQWLDQVLGDARRSGALGVGPSAVVRFALARLQAEPQEKVVAELIRLREAGQDQ